MSPINALQTAIVQRLAVDADLLKLIPINFMADEEKDVRLYSYIPEEAVSPYIHVAGPSITKVYVAPEDVVDVRVTLHLWHNQAETGQYGNTVIANVLEATKRALRFKLSPVGYQTTGVTINEQLIFDDINPDVKHAVFSLTYKLEKIQ